MLSRVADSLYWMGRYLERAEHTARVVSVNLNLSFDRRPEELARHWGRLLAALRMPPTVATRVGVAEAAVDMTLDLANRDSIAACLGAARENARQVREQITSEMWEELNRLHLTVQGTEVAEASQPEHMDSFFRSTLAGIHLFQGVTDATMPHAEGYRFIELGRYIERAGGTAALLDRHYRDFAEASRQPTDVGELVEWAGLLKACHAFEAYCHRYTAEIDASRVAEFLVLDPDFPRSLRFAVCRIEGSLAAIREATRRERDDADRLAGRLRASLDFCHLEEVLEAPAAFLAGISRQTDAISEAVHRQYIDYPIEADLPE
jgi:uncharacterized alpha-E superfamily protein